MVSGEGFYNMPVTISLNIPELPELKQTSETALGKLAMTGKKVAVSNQPSATIRCMLNKTEDKLLGQEGYRLSVKQTGILISANKPAGLFYGLQTLWQLMPQEIDSKTKISDVTWKVSVVEITDYPRFVWRGLMFDVSRHFFTLKDVQDFIDLMVQYKLNLLHMHLTDDEGWRVEIKSLRSQALALRGHAGMPALCPLSAEAV
jgi:hexosaminidase